MSGQLLTRSSMRCIKPPNGGLPVISLCVRAGALDVATIFVLHHFTIEFDSQNAISTNGLAEILCNSLRRGS